MSGADDQGRDRGPDGSHASRDDKADTRPRAGQTASSDPFDNDPELSPRVDNVPRWRQIEIMRERRALREMLDDFDLDELEIEAEVFGSEEERQAYYRRAGEEYEEEEEEVIDVGDEDLFEEE